ncbi:MAG: leucine-rich repeat domain-containing protein, partial [Treponema sp.]|nr:leucine-rich repeat domain-containing protein [Treponema sp.]
MKNTIKTLLIIAFTVIIGVYFVGCPVPEPDPYAPTPGLEFMLINNGTAYSVSKGTAKAAIVVIPAIYEGKPVIEIADSGFSSYTNMTSIIIPDGVTRIGSYAFFHCDNLTSIVIPAGVTNIGNFAFSNCGSLTSVFYGGADTLKYSTITISSNNAPLESAVRYYYSESIPDTINTHWRFVDGAPLVWNLIINTHPVEVTNAFIGHIYDSLFVEAIIAEGTTLSYQWYINTTNSNVGGTAIAGATSANFTIPTTLAVG